MERTEVVLVGALSFLCLLGGCARKEGSHSTKMLPLREKEIVLEYKQAKFPDIPLLLDMQIAHEYCGAYDNQDQSIIGGTSALTMDKVALFYQEEMEYLGWDLQDMFEGPEYLLVFVKPGSRRSVISIRPKGTGSLVIIFSR